MVDASYGAVFLAPGVRSADCDMGQANVTVITIHFAASRSRCASLM